MTGLRKAALAAITVLVAAASAASFLVPTWFSPAASLPAVAVPSLR